MNEAFLLTAPADGRVFFVIPWQGRTLVGTTEAKVADVREAVVTKAEEGYLLDAVEALMPGLGWTQADVLGRFAGVRTLQAEDAASLSAVSREFAITRPQAGLVMPIGGKYTTARVDAIEIVDAVQAELGLAKTASDTHRHALPGAPQEIAQLGQFEGWQAEAMAGLTRRGLDVDIAQALTLRHGTRCARIHALLDENPDAARRLHPQAPFIEAEVTLAAREEMARSVDDVLRRRMPLALLVRPDELPQARVAELLRETEPS